MLDEGKWLYIDSQSINSDKSYTEIGEFIIEWKMKTKDVLMLEDTPLVKIRDNIVSILNNTWVNSLNEFLYFWVKELKELLWKNWYMRYFFKRFFNKSFVHMRSKDLEKLWTKLWLKLLEEDEFISQIKEILKEKDIETLADLNKLFLADFRDLLRSKPLLIYYVKVNSLNTDFLTLSDRHDFWEYIWLKDKKVDKNSELNNFLRSNWINNYSDLYWIWTLEARSLLWSNELCREIISKFWVDLSIDFRLDHLKRFSRYVWLKWVPDEYDNNKSKKFILNILKNKQINCALSLKLFTVKWLRNLLTKETLWTKFKYINTFFINEVWVSVAKLKLEDMPILVEALWLSSLTDEEHRDKLTIYLDSKKDELWEVTKTKIVSWYWKDINIRYFLFKSWFSWNLGKLRPVHVEEMKEYIESI